MRATLDELDTRASEAKEAARLLAKLPGGAKDEALKNIAGGLGSEQERILAANERDIEAARRTGLSESLIDRLLLDPERLEGIAHDVMQVVALPDPVGETFDARTLPSGLQVGRRRVPAGGDRSDIREQTEHHGGLRSALHQVGQRGDPSRRQGGCPLERGSRRHDRA